MDSSKLARLCTNVLNFSVLQYTNIENSCKVVHSKTNSSVNLIIETHLSIRSVAISCF
jgi:hypothetical protein